MRNIFKNILCTLRLGTQLNIAFGAVLFIPMIITALFSVTYYSQKIEQEAAAKIGSDMKIAYMIFREYVSETEKLAVAYSRKREIAALVSLGLLEKLGEALNKDAEKDHIDMICIIDRNLNCIVHSCRPPYTDTNTELYQTEAALSGSSSAGITLMTKAELKKEGLDADSEKVVVITAFAPVYDRNTEKIAAALVILRIVKRDIVEKISSSLNMDTALFQGDNLIASAGSFTLPEQTAACRFRLSELKHVKNDRKIMTAADIRSGGSISACYPLYDFNDMLTGVLMIRTDAAPYLRTRQKAFVIFAGILLTGFMLACFIRNMMYKRLDASHRALKRKADEHKLAEEQIRCLHKELIRSQETERRRIALDIHDSIIQELSALLHRYEAASGGLKPVKECNAGLKISVGKLRTLVYTLCPSGLEQFGLADSVRELCGSFQKDTNIITEFSAAGISDFDYDTGLSLYRIIQEALNNVRKHSQADHVSVKIVGSHDETVIRITDNGRGFDVNNVLNTPPSDGRYMGLRGMKERIRYLNAVTDIDSRIGKGTKIKITVTKKDKPSSLSFFL